MSVAGDRCSRYRRSSGWRTCRGLRDRTRSGSRACTDPCSASEDSPPAVEPCRPGSARSPSTTPRCTRSARGTRAAGRRRRSSAPRWSHRAIPATAATRDSRWSRPFPRCRRAPRIPLRLRFRFRSLRSRSRSRRRFHHRRSHHRRSLRLRSLRLRFQRHRSLRRFRRPPSRYRPHRHWLRFRSRRRQLDQPSPTLLRFPNCPTCALPLRSSFGRNHSPSLRRTNRAGTPGSRAEQRDARHLRSNDRAARELADFSANRATLRAGVCHRRDRRVATRRLRLMARPPPRPGRAPSEVPNRSIPGSMSGQNHGFPGNSSGPRIVLPPPAALYAAGEESTCKTFEC
jgi:hypothetical protein